MKLAILTILLLTGCSQHPASLPHRPLTTWTNWGQGRAPEGNVCPAGTFRFETDEGLFLECYRGSRQ